MEDSNNNSNNNYLDSLNYESFLNNPVIKETTNSFYFVSTKENYENDLNLGMATVSGFDSYVDVIGESVKNNEDTGVVKFSVCDDTSIYFATESELSEKEIEECIKKNYDIILLPNEKGNKYIILNPDIIEKSSFLTNEEAREDYETLQEGYNSALVEMFTQLSGENTAENNDNRKNNQRQNLAKNAKTDVSAQATEEDEKAKKELDNYLEQLAAFNIIDENSEITYDKLLEYQEEYTSLFSNEDGLNVDVSYLKHAISSIKEINPGLLSLNKSVNNFNVNSNIGLSGEYMTQIQSCKDFVNELIKSDADGLSGSVVSYQSRLDKLYDSLHADTSEWQIYEDTLNMQNLEAFAEIEELTDIEKANLAETYAQELSEHATKYRENMSHRTEEILDQPLPSDQNVNIDELLDYANNFRTYYVTTTLDSIARKKYHLDPSNSVLDISEEEQKYYGSHLNEFAEYDQQYRIREYLIVDSKVKNNERLTQWELNYRSENADYFISYAKELDSDLNDRFFKYTNKEYNSYAELESDPTVPVKTCEVELTPEEREIERERLIKEKQERLHTTDAVEIDDSEIPKTKTVAIYNPYSLATDFERCVMMTYITDAYETSNSNYEKMRKSSNKRLDEIQRELSSNYTDRFHEALVSEKYDPYCAGITMGQVCEFIEEKRKGLEYQKEQKEPNEELIKTLEDQIAYEERVLELFHEKMDLYDANGSYASMYEYQAQADSYLLKLNECRQAMIMEKPAAERTDEEKDFVNVDYPQVRLKVRNDYLQWKQALAFSEKYKDSAIDIHMNYYGFETIKKGYDVKGLDDKYVPSQDVSFGGINERYYKQGYEFDETSEIEISELIDKNEVKSAHLFTKKTDFDKNSKTRICKIEQKDTKEGKYLIFYDSNGNEIKDITSSEIAIYCALNNESIPKRRYCNIKDNSTGEIKSIYHDLKDEVKSLGYLDSKETSTKVLSYLCNKALITADASDVNRFNINFNYFTNLGKKTEGKRIANKWLAKAWIPGAVTTRAFCNGLFQFCNGFVNLFGGADGKVSSYDYALMYYSEGLKDKFGVAGEVVSGYNDIVTSIGNMAIPMAVSIIGTYVCPAYAGVFQTISSALMGMSAAGNTVEQGLQMGMTMGQAYTYGILTGLSEAVLERFLGGIPGLSNLERFSELSGIKGLAAKMLSEAIEEGLQEALDPVFMYAVGAGDLVDMSFGEYMSGIAKSAFYGAITAGVLNGLGSVTNKGLSKVVTGTSTGLTIIMSEFAQRGGIFQNMDTFKSFLSEVSSLRKGGDFELSNLKNSISTNPEFVEKYSQYKNNYESKLNDIKSTLKADPDNALAQLQLEQMEKTKLMSFDEFTEYAMMESLLLKTDAKSIEQFTADFNEKINQMNQLSERIASEQDANKKVKLREELSNLNGEILAMQSKIINIINISSFNGDITKISNYLASQMISQSGYNLSSIPNSNYESGVYINKDGIKIDLKMIPDTNALIMEVNNMLGTPSITAAEVITAIGGLEIDQINALIENVDTIPNTEMGNLLKTSINIYQKGLQMASDAKYYKAFFENFRDHGFKHALAVAEYAVKLTNGLDLSQHELNLMAIAALSHDFGMQGGYVYLGQAEINKIKKQMKKKNYSDADIDAFLSNNNIVEKTAMSLKELETILVDSSIFDKTAFVQNYVRGMHPLNSALDILSIEGFIPSELQTYMEKLVKENGLDIDTTNLAQNVVALLAMTHSKSTSGISFFSIKTQWEECIHRLEVSANERGVSINADALRELVNNETIFKILQDDALFIRDGDAMSRVVSADGKSETVMQDGGVGVIDVQNVVGIEKIKDSLIWQAKYNGEFYNVKYDGKEEYIEVGKNRIYLSDDVERRQICKGFFAAASDVGEVVIYSDNTSREVTDIYGRGIHAAELYSDFSSKVTRNASGKLEYEAVMVVKDGTMIPTLVFEEGLKPRFGEVRTYTNTASRKITILLPASTDAFVVQEYIRQIQEWQTDTVKSLVEAKAKGLITEAEFNELLPQQQQLMDNIELSFVEDSFLSEYDVQTNQNINEHILGNMNVNNQFIAINPAYNGTNIIGAINTSEILDTQPGFKMLSQTIVSDSALRLAEMVKNNETISSEQLSEVTENIFTAVTKTNFDINKIGIDKNNINYIFKQLNEQQQKQFFDSLFSRLTKGESFSNDTYNTIFRSELFAADSPFAKQYLHSFLVDMMGGDTTLADKVSNIYDNARTSTDNQKLSNLYSYCDHTESHTLQVAFLTLKALNAISEEAKVTGNINYSTMTEQDYKEMFVAGLLHDLGMAAGAIKVNGVELLQGVNGYLTYENGEAVLHTDDLDFDNKKLADIIRTNHTLNSALAILGMREELSKAGLNADKLAMLCFSHSKSNSGVGLLTESTDWSLCIEKIQQAVAKHNSHSDADQLIFDLSTIGEYDDTVVKTKTAQKMKDANKNEVYEQVEVKNVKFKSGVLSDLATKAFALRVGDAFVSKAKIEFETPIIWEYNGVTYTASEAILTQTGRYMLYDKSKSISYREDINSYETETSDPAAFLYFELDSNGKLVPCSIDYEEIVVGTEKIKKFFFTPNNNYSVENGVYKFGDSSSFMSQMGDSVEDIIVDGRKIKEAVVTDKAYYIEKIEIKNENNRSNIYKKTTINGESQFVLAYTTEQVVTNDVATTSYYAPGPNGTRGELLFQTVEKTIDNKKFTEYYKIVDGKEIELLYNPIDELIGKTIKKSTGQFLSGESNVTYEFYRGTMRNNSSSTDVTGLVSEMIVDDPASFPYNALDKGINERLGELKGAIGIERIVNIKFANEEDFSKMFDIVDVGGYKMLSPKTELGQLYLDSMKKYRAKYDTINIIAINGYEIIVPSTSKS